MSMGGGRGGAAGRVGSRDAEVQRAENASAPRIPNLLGRIGELFRPFAGQLVTTIVLVLISAGLGVLPPLLTQRAFDEGLFPPSGTPDVPVLMWLVGAMVGVWLASAARGAWRAYLTARAGHPVMGAPRARRPG